MIDRRTYETWEGAGAPSRPDARAPRWSASSRAATRRRCADDVRRELDRLIAADARRLDLPAVPPLLAS